MDSVESPFKPGDRVRKIGGSYQASGTIKSVFSADDGTPRYVFRFDNPAGVLHIFGGQQLRLRSETAIPKWDARYLRVCREVASWSKDPSTGVGCCLVDAQNRPISVGFNGLPRGIADSVAKLHDRAAKLRGMIHAEENAILFSQRSLVGATCYVYPLPPCGTCMAKLIQVGIARVASVLPGAALAARWEDHIRDATEQAAEAGVEWVTYAAEDLD